MLNNKNYNNIFHFWLISIIFLVCSIIIVGGLTRLTDSGLSITEWELFRGILPPTTNKEWGAYFESYKKIPQFILLNSNMSLLDFKYIFLWEYAHRALARFIGISFLIPFLFFLFINLLKKDLIFKLSSIFLLILIQGTIGWYMVKSGLVENISVSHYRLSIHLFLAFSILSSLFWILLNFSNNSDKKFFKPNRNCVSIKFLLITIYIQIILGAFVSGLDAGQVYQTWPLMNEKFFPDDVLLSELINFNSPSTVQFLHRNIAYLIFFLSIFIGYNIWKEKDTKVYNIFIFFSFIVLIQIILGVSVLISGVNILFASMHQISSIFLVVSALKLYHSSIAS